MTKRATLTEQVYDGILGLVIDGSFPIGTRLPPEVELCRNYGASRPVVREVLARLRAEGLIESRRGSGSYVLRQTAASPQLPEGVASMAEIEECYDFRIAHEGECAYLAATKRTDDDIAAMNAAFGAFCDGLTIPERGGIHDDFRFHLAIAQATHNAFFVNAFQSIASRVYMAIEISRRLNATPLEARRETLISEHETVLKAIVEGEPAKARRAMRRHVTSSKSRLFKGTNG